MCKQQPCLELSTQWSVCRVQIEWSGETVSWSDCGGPQGTSIGAGADLSNFTIYNAAAVSMLPKPYARG